MSDMSSNELAREIVKLIDGVKGSYKVEVKDRVKKGLLALYKSSKSDDFYFFDCPLDVYKNTFDSRFKSFLDDSIDADRADFIKSEIKKLYDPSTFRVIHSVSYGLFVNEVESFEITLNKKKKFLEQELSKEGWSISNRPEENVSPFDDLPLDDNIRFEKIVELDGRKGEEMLTANQIVLLLEETGFFTSDFISKKSKIDQARIVSMISGLNTKNISRYISKLDLKPSENGENYLKDVARVESLLKSN